MGILNAIDLKQKIKKSDYNAQMEKLEIKLGQLEAQGTGKQSTHHDCIRRLGCFW